VRLPRRAGDVAAWLGALLGPVLITAMLVPVRVSEQRDYVFIYLGLVAVLGVLRGLWPALVAAALSFLLVDYFFVSPVRTLTIADEQDLVNLVAFVTTAGLVGLLASQRRKALLRAEALGRDLRQTNSELARLNKEQARAAQAALTLARSQEQIRALQEVDRSRRELLANVSHELRTPLSTILTESTSSVTEADSSAELHRRLRTITDQAHRLKALVDDMLDLAVIEAGALELHFQPVRLADALQAAVERLHSKSPERRVDWNEQSAGVDVLADALADTRGDGSGLLTVLVLLATGMALLDAETAKLTSTVIPGETVFRLHDTYGFPLDLTADVARERGLTIDQAGFDAAMEAQRVRASAASKFGSEQRDSVKLSGKTDFLGYDRLNDTGVVTSLIFDGATIDALRPGQEGQVVLDHTPFYAESGGQIGDAGVLVGATARFTVPSSAKIRSNLSVCRPITALP